MTQKQNKTFLDTVNLNDLKQLRKAISFLTDAVYNSSDTASFTDNDIKFISRVRKQVDRDQLSA